MPRDRAEPIFFFITGPGAWGLEAPRPGARGLDSGAWRLEPTRPGAWGLGPGAPGLGLVWFERFTECFVLMF